ncbi:pyridoxamine 5'-phosphate oxidase family protein [Massilia sp. R2A-15]|uniref:pyridoxamine 5'-phosphate oxidase family protein n=1 Tax=Massilia sp. R2A-15 TaxID=3064278 RepID=UPI0027341615|nr:pyridoxamine 5'-phosphate oxidase family protein [Massilia sp. R2A-15]WLI87440.1 pyridoxamine 5'-phosphate oxidase family protein [Massilia sp. R2A-15]
MDSINKQQPEHNHQDLAGKDAVEKLKKLVEDADTCFFCTADTGSETGGARPMSVREVDDNGDLWFLSASDSHKNLAIGRDPAVQLYFRGSAHSGFLSVKGTATITRDPARIKALWNFVLKTWFTEGEDDPRITAIKVTPTSAYYWDNKHGNAVAGAKILVGAVIGKTLDDSIEGTLKP